MKLPENCPICNSKLVWKGVDLICENPNCDNIKLQDLLAFSEVLGEIDNLAWLTKKKYFDLKHIKSVEDLMYYINSTLENEREYYTSITDLKMLEMFDKLSYKDFDLDTALLSLNIERLGKETAKKLANNKDAYNVILTLSKNIVNNIFIKKRVVQSNTTFLYLLFF